MRIESPKRLNHNADRKMLQKVTNSKLSSQGVANPQTRTSLGKRWIPYHSQIHMIKYQSDLQWYTGEAMIQHLLLYSTCQQCNSMITYEYWTICVFLQTIPSKSHHLCFLINHSFHRSSSSRRLLPNPKQVRLNTGYPDRRCRIQRPHMIARQIRESSYLTSCSVYPRMANPNASRVRIITLHNLIHLRWKLQ